MENTAKHKSKHFAVRIIRLYQYLCDEKREFVMSKQLLRSGTSIGANLAEAECAISRKDFLAKVYIALKECAETKYWLELLAETDYLTQTQFSSIASDCEELRKMLSSTTKTINSTLHTVNIGGIMEKITSFTIDHIKLQPGLYVSRKDKVGSETVTTFDLRLTKPNGEPVMNTAEVHTMEHLAATYLRNQPDWKDRVIYFGPMGCRTGFYLLLAGDYASEDVLELVKGCFCFIRDFRDEVPGASAKDCGNYLDMNLPMANYWGGRYAALLENITPDRLVYPE